MEYKNFVATTRTDPGTGVIRGRVINIRDSVTFYGKTSEEAETAFRTAVDAYLRYCLKARAGVVIPASLG